MIGQFLTINVKQETGIIGKIQDLSYKSELATKKQQRQFTQKNEPKSQLGYKLKYWNQIANDKPFSTNINDYELYSIDPEKQVILDITLSIKVLAPPPVGMNFTTPIYLALYDGVNILESFIVTNLSIPNFQIASIEESKEQFAKKSQIYFGLFIDPNLTIAQKNYIDTNISIDWTLFINQISIV